PTEEEWEYAARGREKLLYPWGNDFNSQLANTMENGKNQPVEVGSYPGGASPFGVLDMAGNVDEWTASEYKPYPGGPPSEPGFKGEKIVRGGSYSYDKAIARVTDRRLFAPNTVRPYIGFRCAKDSPEL